MIEEHLVPAIETRDEVLGLKVETRKTPDYRSLFIRHEGRVLVTVNQVIGRPIVWALGVSGYMPMPDLHRFCQSLKIALETINQWEKTDGEQRPATTAGPAKEAAQAQESTGHISSCQGPAAQEAKPPG